MDNLFEILVPIIFAALYFFGNMFTGKSKEESDPSERPSRRRQEDPDALERQRRIQEEIRRKIMERRAGGEGGRSRPQQTTESPRQSDPEPASRNPEPASRRPAQEGAFNWDRSDDIYANQMQERMRKIEETKRRAAKLQRQAEAKTEGRESASSRRSDRHSGRRSRSLLSGPVRETLRDPAAARAAFIYGEVLGSPVSQRKTSSVPGLS